MKNNTLVVEAKMNASASRTLRNDEVKWRNKARAAKERAMKKGANEYQSPAFYDERRMESYRDRMAYRNMSRHINLAMGYIKGLSYQQIENSSYSQPDVYLINDWLLRVEAMPKGEDLNNIKEWLNEHLVWDRMANRMVAKKV